MAQLIDVFEADRSPWEAPEAESNPVSKALFYVPERPGRKVFRLLPPEAFADITREELSDWSAHAAPTQ